MSAAAEKSPKLTDTLRVVRIGIRGMYRSRLPQMSAALAFRTLFALIPMLVISVAAIGAFAEPDDVRSIMIQTFDKLGLNDIQAPARGQSNEQTDSAGDVATPAAVSKDPSGADAVTLAEESAEGDADEAEVSEIVSMLMMLVEQFLSLPFGAIGTIGILTLIYASISMLIEIERACNNVYRAQVGKAWGKRLVQYWTIITLVPILLFTAFYASERFRGIDVGIAGSVAGSVVSISITALLLLLAYVIIPNTRVHVRSGVVGALVAAILWEIAKWGFRQYIGYSVTYSKLYGPMAIIPLFMLWVYLTWLIILFGLQVSYGLQHIELASRIDEDDAEDRLTDPAAVLGVLAVIGERFARGKTTRVGHLTDELSLSAEVVGTVVGKLIRSELIRDVDGSEDRYVLAMPAEAIQLDRAMDVMSEITDSGRGSKSSWGGAIDRLENARLEIVRGQSVADLLRSRDEARDSQTSDQEDPE